MTEAISRISDIIDRLKGLALHSLWLVAAALLAMNFSGVNGAIGNLLSRASAMQVKSLEVEGFGAKISMEAVASALKDVGQTDASKQKSAFLSAQALSGDEFIRLMNVGRLANTCVFSQPDAQMRRFAEIDAKLQYRGLVTLADDSATLRKIARETRKGDPLGAPIRCYAMRLTSLGADVASALVKSFSETFDPAPKES